VTAGDRVVEIGPGLGTLTAALLEAGAEVWAVEKDRTLHAHLAETLALRFPAALHLKEGDAVEHPLAGLPAGAGADFKVVADLPYAIATPWLDEVLSGPLPSRMVLMLQQEAAQRYSAGRKPSPSGRFPFSCSQPTMWRPDTRCRRRASIPGPTLNPIS
jgi:16S rRNA (adenine1518-N6/adenine1519-N6)-dimethyltransferase